MTRVRWAVAGLLVGAAAIAVATRHDPTQPLRIRAERLAFQNESLKVELAAARVSSDHVDTIWRRAKARVDTLRDTIPLWRHDTAYVSEYVTRADSALQACSDLANLCQRYKTVAERLIQGQREEIAVGQDVAKQAIGRAVRAERVAVAAFVVGAVLGAWVRGR